MNDFRAFVTKVNSEISKRSSRIGDFQKLRAQYRKGKVGDYRFFNVNEKFVERDHYTFNIGGSDEFQFNMGYDKKDVFRFGLAISLETSQSVNDPISSRDETITRFNSFLEKYPKYLQEYEMWTWMGPKNNRERANERDVEVIDKKTLNIGDFIFLGKWLNESELDQKHVIPMIVDVLEYLLPVYEYVQFSNDHPFSEKKVTRIVFNENGWTRPSGRLGKSNDLETHEGKHGFGYEEWLFDFGKLIDGYHYTFLQAISGDISKHKGKRYDISVFTKDARVRHSNWIGEIKDVEVLSENLANEAFKHYKSEKWFDIISNDFDEIGLNGNELISAFDSSVFNIRFKPENAHVVEDGIEVEVDDKSIPGYRYKLMDFRSLPKTYAADTDFKMTETAARKKLKSRTKGTSRSFYFEITLLHNEISLGLEKYLRSLGHIVCAENSTGYQTRIDIATDKGSERMFFEIKTSLNVKECIRYALGQLMEYSYFPDRSLATKLVVVGIGSPTQNDKIYIENLRASLKLPIYYWQYSLEKGVVNQKI